MSWAEEQDWFGLEDLALEAIREQEENSFYVVLIGYNNQDETLIDYPFDTKEEAIKKAMSYKGKYKTAKIIKGKSVRFKK